MIANSAVPVHDEVGWGQRTFEVSCIAGASILLVLCSIHVFSSKFLWTWPMGFAIVVGALSADFISGMVHWICDTWFHDSLPFFGPRFLRPFRVHHVNPNDFLRRDFIDTNGDVSMLVIAVLLPALFIPLKTAAEVWLAAYVLAFSFVAWPTNQVHQWAHMPQPPRWVARLQSFGLILSRPAHRKHHIAPYATNYCIATGWLNRPLSSINFFARLEMLITRITGLQPRVDDSAYELRLESPTVRDSNS
jgi:ubiquitin-conjugating enzyme E2 variant